jgi:hypothetical protein
MKAREYDLMQLAVEDGVAIGYARAYKHTDEPSEHEMKDHLQREIMNQICEWFDFEDQSRELW